MLGGYQGVFRVCSVSETAQVELRSGRVQDPAAAAAVKSRERGRQVPRLIRGEPHARRVESKL